jgi:hypothetical protein
MNNEQMKAEIKRLSKVNADQNADAAEAKEKHTLALASKDQELAMHANTAKRHQQSHWLKDMAANQMSVLKEVNETFIDKNNTIPSAPFPLGCKMSGQGQLNLAIEVPMTITEDDIVAIADGARSLLKPVNARLMVYAWAGCNKKGNRYIGAFVNDPLYEEVDGYNLVKVMASNPINDFVERENADGSVGAQRPTADAAEAEAEVRS